MTWEREEWLAARAADEHRPHPPGCTCQECARDAVTHDTCPHNADG